MVAAKKKSVKTPGASKTQVAKYLDELLEGNMSLGNRAAIQRTLQIVKGER